jgi:peptidoglycan/LPS O-acetylase OafA/YrhL
MTEVLTAPRLIPSKTTRPTPSDPQPRPRKFRPDIEGLRAVSVILVVLYHAHLGVRGGFVGVDVFFVISGFLITGQLLKSVGTDGLRALPVFYSRRIKRLLPASVAVVIATVIATRIWVSALEVRGVATDGVFTSFYGLNYRLAAEGTQYLHATDSVSPLQHFWSLAVEEQFYVGWPLLIIAILALARWWRTPVLTVALVGLIALSYYWSITITGKNAPWAYFSLQTRAWELALGALVAVGATTLARLPRLLAEFGAAAGLIAVGASAFLLSDATQYPGSLAALPVGGAALVIACGVGSRRRIERFLGESAMQCIGRISYSWYLWHWPMLIIAPSVVGHALTWQGRVIVVWLSMFAAIASYFFVEDPGRRWQLQPVRWIGAGAAMSAAVVAVAFVVIANPPSVMGKGNAVTLASGTITTGTGTEATNAANTAFLNEVTNAVQAGLATSAAPSNLTPNPAHAGSDTPDPSKDGCHLDFLPIDQGPCVYGDPNGTHTIVLFGDSHIEQWQPAFAKAGTELHWKVVNWTKSACPAAELTVIAPTLNRPYTECDTWRQQTIDRIGALNPDVIVVGESENAKGVKAITPADWTSSTIRTLDALKAKTTSRITFLGDNPVPQQLVPACVAAHLSDVRPCQTDAAHQYTYPDRHRAVEPAVTKAGYAYLDPRTWVCAPGGCPPIIGNILVNRDATHISREYVEYLTPLIAPLLDPGRRS